MTFLDDIHSNRIMVCLHCGAKITPFNYSGWDAFTEDGKTTQPICTLCNFDMDLITEKSDHIDIVATRKEFLEAFNNVL